MRKIKQTLSMILAICCVLSGCGKSDVKQNENNSVLDTVMVDKADNQSMLVGRWQGTGYFDSLARQDEECTYILDFFEDGSMTISSSNMYFHGVEVEDMSLQDNMVDFSIPYNNPVGNLDYVPVDYREMMKIHFSLKIGKDELNGISHQNDWSWGTDIVFKKISDIPRSFTDTDVLTIEQMEEDVNMLFSILESTHPNIYYTQSKEEYKKRKSELLAKLPSLDKESFYFELKRFVASIGDRHTGIFQTLRMSYNNRFLPISIDYFSGKWYIVGADKKYKQLLGKEITSINDISIDALFDEVTEFVAAENKAGAQMEFKSVIKDVDLLEYAGIISDGQATISTNENEHVIVSAVVRSEYNTGDGMKIGQSSVTSYKKDSDYWYQALNNDIFYIQYNSCTDSVDYPITKFGEEVANEMDSNKYKKIVIDLRYNGGGSSGLINTFIDSVLKAHNDGVQLYCLIGEQTFSAAFDNAIYFKQEGIPLVGQPTGGNMQQFTQVSMFDLPNSRFSGQYSTVFVNYDENAPYDSLYPDKQIDHTIEAYIKGIDEEIEYIKKQ